MKAKRNTCGIRSSKPDVAFAVVRGSDALVMEDDIEPKPMKKYMPANKHPNAVDSFRETHQADREDREEPPDRCRQVDEHNDAYPKLKDELKKKRSAVKVSILQSTYGTQTLGWFNPRCRACAKLESQRKKSLRKNRRNRSRVTRVAKTKRSRSRKVMVSKALSMIFGARNINLRNTKSNLTKAGGSHEADVDKPVYMEHEGPTAANQGSSSSVVSNLSTRYPDSKSSVTSYYSYASMDHEPML